jgi:hypothetical protein
LGDTFDISLTTTYGGYVHKVEYTLEVPSILEQNGYIYHYICQGDKFIYNGQEYSQPGQYFLDVVTSSAGCDSTTYLVVEYLDPEFVDLYDTICYKELPYDFYGQSCYETGAYEHIIKAQGGCDSVAYRMNLTVLEALKVELNTVGQICSGDSYFDVNYTVLDGIVSEVSVVFSAEAKEVGFVDATMPADNTGWCTIALPSDVKPNTYTAELQLKSFDCNVLKLPLSIPVLYSNEIIIQRWNDVLAVSKKEADYYNGFSTYQWYIDGMPIEGAIGSYYYCPDGLQMSGNYQVEVTRQDDATKIMSCPYIPTLHPNTSTLVVQPTAVAPATTIQVIAPQEGDVDVVGNTGNKVKHLHMMQGQNTMTAPSVSGLYFIHLTSVDGKQYVQKIIVY